MLQDVARKQNLQISGASCHVMTLFSICYREAKIPEPAPAEPEPPGAPAREKSSMSKTSKEASRPATPEPQVPLHIKDLIRMIAEVHFINGEVGLTVKSALVGFFP